jgi:hypothetical protein
MVIHSDHMDNIVIHSDHMDNIWQYTLTIDWHDICQQKRATTCPHYEHIVNSDTTLAGHYILGYHTRGHCTRCQYIGAIHDYDLFVHIEIRIVCVCPNGSHLAKMPHVRVSSHIRLEGQIWQTVYLAEYIFVAPRVKIWIIVWIIIWIIEPPIKRFDRPIAIYNPINCKHHQYHAYHHH